MKRRSFFQRVLAAFGAAVVADKVVAKNETTVVPNTAITGTQGMYVTPTATSTPSIIPSPTPSFTNSLTRTPSWTPYDYYGQPRDGQIVLYNQFTKRFVPEYEDGVIPIVKKVDGFYSYITEIKLDL